MPELKDLTVEFISLVDRPANGKPLVLKSQGKNKPTMFRFAKMDDALMRAYGIVYSPDEVDSQGDWATADTIRQAATKFMRQKNQDNVDKQHSYSQEMAFVAESWLIRKADPMFPSEKDGAWAVGIQVNDPELWKQLKSGDLAGISLAGFARVVDPNQPSYTSKGDELPGWFAKLFPSLVKSHGNDKNQQPGTQEADMSLSKEEIIAIVGQTVSAAFEKRDAEEAKRKEKADAEAANKAALEKAMGDLKTELLAEIAKGLSKGGTEGAGGEGGNDTIFG